MTTQLQHDLSNHRYPSIRHESIAVSVANGFIPKKVDRTWQQQAAIDAFLDGSTDPHSYHTVKITHLGNGHKEGVACRVKVDPWKALCRRYFEPKQERGAGDRERSIQDAAKRAKTKVRQQCKALGANSLGTLTYRDNITDRDLVLKHWKEWVRRVKRVLGHFDYVAAPERQKRGALHIHIAMRRLPAKVQFEGHTVKSWDFMRAVWRRVIGGSGGNFDEQKKLGCGSRARVMKIAAYLSKYVVKEFGDDELLNRKRYFASDRVQPIVTRTRFDAWEFGDVIAMLYTEVGDELTDFTTFLGHGEFFWFSAHEGGVTT